MLQDFAVGVAFGGHDGGADLAETYSVTPAGSVKDKSLGCFFYYECAAEQVTFGQGAANLQFLAYGDCLLGALNLQFIDTARWTALNRP